MTRRLALLTCEAYADNMAQAGDWYQSNILLEDRLLGSALAQFDIQCQRHAWSDDRVDWSIFDAVVLRSTWDYFHRFEEFDRWLDRVSRQTRLCNPLSMLRWNMDKHYLSDLAASGIAIVPTVFIEPSAAFRPLSQWMRLREWSQAIVKPCISGAARHTYRLDLATADAWQRAHGELLAKEAFMLQPFQHSIITSGEDTLIMAGDEVTHAVRKRAKAGDFRVQDDHGGTVQPWHAGEEQIELAQRAVRACKTIAACAALPLYGRVDMVRGQDDQWLVMELELVEPELWMRLHPRSAEQIARSIAHWLG